MTDKTELDKRIFGAKHPLDERRNIILLHYTLICLQQLQTKKIDSLSEKDYEEIVDNYYNAIGMIYSNYGENDEINLFVEMTKQTDMLLEKYGKNNVMADIVQKINDKTVIAAIATTTTTTTASENDFISCCLSITPATTHKSIIIIPPTNLL